MASKTHSMAFPKWKNIDEVARAVFPVSLTFVLILINFLPASIWPQVSLIPVALLISVYYWSVFRPDLMPLWAVFLLAAFYDLISGGPVGLNIFCMLLLSYIISKQRRFYYHASFLLIWITFALHAVLIFGIVWILGGLLVDRWVDVWQVVLQLAFTVILYPVFAGLFSRVQQGVLKSQWPG